MTTRISLSVDPRVMSGEYLSVITCGLKRIQGNMCSI